MKVSVLILEIVDTSVNVRKDLPGLIVNKVSIKFKNIKDYKLSIQFKTKQPEDLFSTCIESSMVLYTWENRKRNRHSKQPEDLFSTSIET